MDEFGRGGFEGGELLGEQAEEGEGGGVHGGKVLKHEVHEGTRRVILVLNERRS
jgi:hypothetical protein